MRARKAEVKVILNWIGNDPFKEALLISEAPIGRTTLSQMKSGKYLPSSRMISALLSVKSAYPDGVPGTGGLKTGT